MREYLAIEQFVAELAIEALAVAVLPRAAGLDIGRPRSDGGDPVAQRLGNELSGPLSGRMRAGDEIDRFNKAGINSVSQQRHQQPQRCKPANLAPPFRERR